MDIFGLSPVVATILIVSTGIVLQNFLGWLKSKENYDTRSALASTVIAFVVGITIIGPQIEAIQDQMLSDLSELTIVASLIASIAGFDVLTKNAFKIANQKINLQNKPVWFIDWILRPATISCLVKVPTLVLHASKLYLADTDDLHEWILRVGYMQK